VTPDEAVSVAADVLRVAAQAAVERLAEDGQLVRVAFVVHSEDASASACIGGVNVAEDGVLARLLVAAAGVVSEREGRPIVVMRVMEPPPGPARHG
jgi:hypothetical protein